jgi:hypothetical protein
VIPDTIPCMIAVRGSSDGSSESAKKRAALDSPARETGRSKTPAAGARPGSATFLGPCPPTAAPSITFIEDPPGASMTPRLPNRIMDTINVLHYSDPVKSSDGSRR